MSSFVKLRGVRLYNSVACETIIVGENDHVGNELELLNDLDNFTVTIKSSVVFEKFVTCEKFLKCTQFPCLDGVRGINISHLTKMTCRPYSLAIQDCGILSYSSRDLVQDDFHDLQSMAICDYSDLRDLSWFFGALRLQTLSVCSCPEMKEIIQVEKLVNNIVPEVLFPHVVELKLASLPKLKSIYEKTILPFPFLKKIEVHECSKLSNVPQLRRPTGGSSGA